MYTRYRRFYGIVIYIYTLFYVQTEDGAETCRCEFLKSKINSVFGLYFITLFNYWKEQCKF
jgi:hypothetical protein